MRAAERDLNHELYCQDCMVKISPVLKSIPQVYGKTWVESDQYTLDELKIAYTNYFTDRSKNNILVARQLFAELTNIESNDRTVTNIVPMPDGDYRFSYWNNSNEVVSIEKMTVGYFKPEDSPLQ